MSSRPDHRRPQRDWERDDRDRYSRGGGGRNERGRGGRRDEPRKRSSRSRSPRRGGDRDRDHRSGRRDYRRDDDRRDDKRDAHRRDDRRDRDRERDKDRREDRKRDEREYSRSERRDQEPKHPSDVKESGSSVSSQPPPPPVKLQPGPSKLVHNDEQEEDGEMDAVNEDDAAMLATMGMSGFGSSKGKHVIGNQEGTVDIKKQRTWRQYMNRRGGFNRPLDKIK